MRLLDYNNSTIIKKCRPRMISSVVTGSISKRTVKTLTQVHALGHLNCLTHVRLVFA